MQVVVQLEASPKTARIIVAGNHGVIRAALRRLVECEEGMTVVRECESRPGALAESLRAQADLILLDLDLSARCAGVLEQVGALLRAANGTPVLILTASDECHAVQFALQHGAVGFVMKDRSPEVLRRAIGACLAGETWIERSTMAGMFRSSAAASENTSAIKPLTSRERQIIELVALGLHNKAIADRLTICETTVRHHLTSIFDKLDVSNRLELMRKVFDGTSFLQPAVLAAP
jgi:DNA-binding NarL/FixJ family response regulator